MTIRNKKLTKLVLLLIVFSALAAACNLPSGGTDIRTSEEKLFNGVTYTKQVYSGTRRLVVHIVQINVARSNIKPIITPADAPKSDQPYIARTVSQFAEEFEVQLAINGSPFRPWYDHKLTYYPHVGDPVSPLGRTITNNLFYDPEVDHMFPLLTFGGKRPVDIGYIDADVKYAISGTRMLVENGEIVEGLDEEDKAPRTAAGIDAAGHLLTIVVVDGRQIGYSRGVTIQELAQLLKDQGVENALELDGGGSSTLVVNTGDGVEVLNSPIHRGIPGNERPVATQIGFYIK